MEFEDATYKKVTRRLIPLLILCYIIAYMDRVNIGFAKLQMMPDLGFSEKAYGLGAGIFFLGYFLFEVPSNIILHKVGARLWIGRIMIIWGLVSAGMMLVTTELQFYIMRFILGVAEAGFFPGIILYITYWYPAQRRGRVTSSFMTGIALAGVIGGPISGWIMKSWQGIYGWQGWQWLFLLEGIPAVVMGFVVMGWLDDRIGRARWLSDEERALLERNMVEDEQHKIHMPVAQALKNGKVWVMSLIYFNLVMAVYGIGFWLPTIIKSMGIGNSFLIGLISAIPWAAAVVTMLVAARSSDRQHERRWHVAIPALLAAVGFVLSVIWSQSFVLGLLALTLATMGVMTTLPLFWSLPTAFLRGTGAAAGFALINSLGNLAGFVSPYLISSLKDWTQSTNVGMYVLAGCLCLAALMTLGLPARPKTYSTTS